MEKVTSQNEYLKRRLEELEFILHKSHKRNLVFDDLSKRLGKLEDKVNSHVTYSSTQFEAIKFHNSLIGERVQTLEGQQLVKISHTYLIEQ